MIWSCRSTWLRERERTLLGSRVEGQSTRQEGCRRPRRYARTMCPGRDIGARPTRTGARGVRRSTGLRPRAWRGEVRAAEHSDAADSLVAFGSLRAADARPVAPQQMTAARWFEVAIGFVIPTATVVWILWSLWRWFNPGAIRPPERFLAGITEFLLLCVFVILVILAWELFKTWRQPTHSTESHAPASGLRPTGHEPDDSAALTRGSRNTSRPACATRVTIGRGFGEPLQSVRGVHRTPQTRIGGVLEASMRPAEEPGSFQARLSANLPFFPVD